VRVKVLRVPLVSRIDIGLYQSDLVAKDDWQQGATVSWWQAVMK
jgi:hypothetical protein